jgi:hypothetical protein
MSDKRGFSKSIGGSVGSAPINATSVGYSQSKGITPSGKPPASFGHYAPKPDNSCGGAAGPVKQPSGKGKVV